MATFIGCQSRYAQCRGHCMMKPRCRWYIGNEEKLAPYRLKVILVENRRVNGKVKQETISVLGSIDAHLLPDFYADVNPVAADQMKAKGWTAMSLRERSAFWEGVNKRLGTLSNRLGPDRKRILNAVHKRVPWPMGAERNTLELLEAESDLALSDILFKQTRRSYQAMEEMVKHANERMAKEGMESVRLAKRIEETKKRIAALRSR